MVKKVTILEANFMTMFLFRLRTLAPKASSLHSQHSLPTLKSLMVTNLWWYRVGIRVCTQKVLG